MQTKEKSGVGYIPKTAEELAPYKYWISWLKKIAVNVVRSYHLPDDIGYKYKAYDHWEILILHAFKNLHLDETSDRHNQLLYDMKNSHRRHKKGPNNFYIRVKKGGI